MKKIAFVTPGWSPVPATKGGAVENLIEFLLNENEKKHEFYFTIFSIYEKKAQILSRKYKYSDFTFIKYPKSISRLDLFVYWIAKNILRKKNLISYRNIILRMYVLLQYSRKIEPNQFDKIIFVTNSTLFLLLKWSRRMKESSNKVIYYLHNEVRSVFGCEKEISDIAGVISISEFVEKAFLKDYSCLRKKNNNILMNCVDTHAFTIIDTAKIQYYKDKFVIKNTDYVVIFTGRIVREKGVWEVVKAIKKIGNKIPLKLLIVGGGFYSSNIVDPYMKTIQKEIDDIKDRVIITGYINYDDIPSIYRLGNIAILPSMWDEPAGLTMVEAVISGLPLITTKSGGIPEYIPKECAFLLERDGDIISNIANTIEYLYVHPEEAKKMSERGRKLVDVYNLTNYFACFTEAINTYY